MAKITHKKRFFSMLGLVLLISSLFAIPVHAEGALGGYIHMSPVKTSIELEPGETYHGAFKITSTSSKDFSYHVFAGPYQTVGENGDAAYDIENRYTEISKWIIFDKTNYTISPNETQEVTYVIKVPDNAAGGGQYAMLYAETENPQDPGNYVQTNSRLGQLLYAKVDGETNECVKILDNNVNTFMFEPPIYVKSLIENCGNVHAEATYIMKVYPLFSDDTIYANEETPEEHTILPETRRFNTQSWTKEDGAPMMGIFNVEQTVKIGKETSTVKKLVFIFPLWLVIVIILFIGAVIFWLVSRSRQRKESKRSSVNTPDPSSD